MIMLLFALTGCGENADDVADRMEKIVTGNNPLEVESISQEKYAYNTLPDNTKLVYDEILYAIMHREERYRSRPQMSMRWSWLIWQFDMIIVICSG